MNEQINDIADLFDINSDRDNESGEGSNDYSTYASDDVSSKPSFDDLVEEVGDQLDVVAKKSPSLDVPKAEHEYEDDTEVKAETDEAESIIKGSMARDDIKIPKERGEIDYDEVFSSSAKGEGHDQAEYNIEEKDSDQDSHSESNKSVDDSAQQSPKRPEEAPNTSEQPNGICRKEASMESVNDDSYSGEVEWLLDCPSEKYERFYDKKREELPFLLPNGQIKFRRVQAELRESHVQLELDTFDKETIGRQMSEVEELLHRVSQIQLDLNDQYYRWKRFIDLFRGNLARVDYEKPAVRQDGVIYDHMRDFEAYFSKLEALYLSANQVYKTLEAAFDCLSRQLTIVLRDSNVEKPTIYSNSGSSIKHSESRPVKLETELEDYDQLEEGVSSDSHNNDGWGSIDSALE